MIAPLTVAERNVLSPVADVTDESEACAKFWYAATVRMNGERSASKSLDSLGIENFVATQTEIHDWSDRRKRIERVLIPMIVFVKASGAEINRIASMSFVYGVMRNPGEKGPSVIPSTQIERLRRMLKNADSPVTFGQLPPTVGEQVRVVKGKMRGFVGELQSEADNRSRIIVRLGCLGCASLSLPLSHVERIAL